MIKRRRGFIIGLLVIVLLTISFVIIINNKEKEKGGLTVFEVNSSKIIITDNDKSMTIVDGEKEKFTNLIKKIVNSSHMIDSSISKEECDLKIDFDNSYVVYISQEKQELLFDGEVKKIEYADLNQIKEYISKLR